MNKIDHRHHYVMVLDTETANTYNDEEGRLDTSSALVYDCGWSVVDTKGRVYVERSFMNKDIFIKEKDLMKSAYYAKKIPQYWEDIKSGKRKLASTYEIRQTMVNDLEEWGITEVVAHNAYFDYSVLNVLQRWMTKSKYRYWFPHGIEIWDTMKMARDVIHKMPTFRKFCEENNLLLASGNLPTTAEVLYKFITKNPDFKESHTGLEDVQIEREIMFYCYKQHKKMRKKLWENEIPEPTKIQHQIMQWVRAGVQPGAFGGMSANHSHPNNFLLFSLSF